MQFLALACTCLCVHTRRCLCMHVQVCACRYKCVHAQACPLMRVHALACASKPLQQAGSSRSTPKPHTQQRERCKTSAAPCPWTQPRWQQHPVAPMPCTSSLFPPSTRSHFPRSERDSAPSPNPNQQLKTSPASLITSPHGKIRLSPGPSSKVTPKNRAGAGAPCWLGFLGRYLGAIAAPRGQGTDGTEIRLAAVARVSGTGTGPCSIGPIAVPLGQIPPSPRTHFSPCPGPHANFPLKYARNRDNNKKK